MTRKIIGKNQLQYSHGLETTEDDLLALEELFFNGYRELDSESEASNDLEREG